MSNRWETPSTSTYVCIEVAFRGNANRKGLPNWALGRDPSGSWVQCPNPAETIGPASLTLTCTSAQCRFPSQLFLWEAKGDLHPHMHRGRITPGPTASTCFPVWKEDSTIFCIWNSIFLQLIQNRDALNIIKYIRKHCQNSFMVMFHFFQNL